MAGPAPAPSSTPAAAAAAAVALLLVLVLPASTAETATTAATTDAPASNETANDAILARMLDNVLEDVPTPRSGVARTSWVVHGSVTAVWSSYSSYTGGSFGGGFSEFFGAGGSIILQGDATGSMLSRYNTLYPGFGSSGQWVTQPRQDRSIAASAAGSSRRTTLPDSPSAPSADADSPSAASAVAAVPMDPSDVRVLMTQLWGAVALRDNIVTVFGYILHVPDNPLSTDMYSSLYHVYDAIRLRRVQTFPLIGAVQDMAGAGPVRQLAVLFAALAQIAPQYLGSAVALWHEACLAGFPLIDQMLRPGGGPLVVDLLAGIDASIIWVFMKELNWNHDGFDLSENPKVQELMGGSVFEDVFVALQTGALPLTQELFAVIMLNRPSNDVVAEKDETERYLSDVLRLGNVGAWSDIVGKLDSNDMSDPDELLSKVLLLMSQHKDVDPLIRDDARYLRNYLQPPSRTFANKYYEITSRLVSQPSIDFLTMLKAITVEEYPKEVVDMKNRLVRATLNGQLNVQFITKGFNRFDHVTPVNLLIALLTRIDRRMPNAPKSILQAANLLQVHLIYKEFHCSLATGLQGHLLDASAILTAFDSPRVPKRLLAAVQDVLKGLTQGTIPWDDVAKRIPPEKCVRPRQCTRNFFKALANSPFVEKETRKRIEKLLNELDEKGNAKANMCWRKKKMLEALRQRSPAATAVAVPASADPWTMSSEDMAFLQMVGSVAAASGDSPLPLPTAVQSEEPAQPAYPATALPSTRPGSRERRRIEPALALLSWERLRFLLGKAFEAPRPAKKLPLLISVFQALSNAEAVTAVPELAKYVGDYLQQLQTFKKSLSAVSMIHFPSLLNALPAAITDIERQYMSSLNNHFSKPDFYHELGDDFDPKRYKTRGEMLTYVLEICATLPILKWDKIFERAIKHYTDKVFHDGYGAQEVEWALVSEAADPTYVDLSVFRALDHYRMSKEDLQAEYDVIHFLFTEFIPNVHLGDLNVRKFNTKGRFLKAAFEYMMEQSSVSPKIKADIRRLMKFVRLNGPGSEPLDYNNEEGDGL